MQWSEVLYFIPMLIAATITASLTIYAWRHRDASAATSFAALMLVVTIWLLISGLAGLSYTPEAMHFWDNLTGRLIVLRDITERKQAEEALQALNHRMQDELALAHEIQKSLLPPPHPDWPGLEVICYNAPAQELGGDFYRYYAFPSNGRKEREIRYAFAIPDNCRWTHG